jgi:hypothetical protein
MTLQTNDLVAERPMEGQVPRQRSRLLRRIAAWAALWLASLLITASFAASVAYVRGGHHARQAFALASANLSVEALHRLRSGAAEQATSVLERSLETDILLLDGYSEARTWPWSWLDRQSIESRGDDKMLQNIIDYKRAYPDPDANATIESDLQRVLNELDRALP